MLLGQISYNKNSKELPSQKNYTKWSKLSGMRDIQKVPFQLYFFFCINIKNAQCTSTTRKVEIRLISSRRLLRYHQHKITVFFSHSDLRIIKIVDYRVSKSAIFTHLQIVKMIFKNFCTFWRPKCHQINQIHSFKNGKHDIFETSRFFNKNPEISTK